MREKKEGSEAAGRYSSNVFGAAAFRRGILRRQLFVEV
jgi:hypothetical protein